MNKVELLVRLADIEWDNFEVKEAHTELPKNIWETVSAFANSAGGWIVLGVSQTGRNFEISGVENPGSFPLPIQELLKKDVSFPRNPVIAKLFRNVKLAENAGYGFHKMLKWEEVTQNKVCFENSIAFTLVTFNLPKITEDYTGIEGGKSAEFTPPITPPITELEKKLLTIIEQKPEGTRKVFAEILGISDGVVKEYIENLKQKGILQRVGNNRTGYWKIKPERETDHEFIEN